MNEAAKLRRADEKKKQRRGGVGVGDVIGGDQLNAVAGWTRRRPMTATAALNRLPPLPSIAAASSSSSSPSTTSSTSTELTAVAVSRRPQPSRAAIILPPIDDRLLSEIDSRRRRRRQNHQNRPPSSSASIATTTTTATLTSRRSGSRIDDDVDSATINDFSAELLATTLFRSSSRDHDHPRHVTSRAGDDGDGIGRLRRPVSALATIGEGGSRRLVDFGGVKGVGDVGGGGVGGGRCFKAVDGGQGRVRLAVRLPDGRRFVSIFSTNETISDVVDYIRAKAFIISTSTTTMKATTEATSSASTRRQPAVALFGQGGRGGRRERLTPVDASLRSVGVVDRSCLLLDYVSDDDDGCHDDDADRDDDVTTAAG